MGTKGTGKLSAFTRIGFGSDLSIEASLDGSMGAGAGSASGVGGGAGAGGKGRGKGKAKGASMGSMSSMGGFSLSLSGGATGLL